MVKKMKRELFCKILNSEMQLATGCTEPAAVALCAAYASEQLGTEVAEVHVLASVNIIKNAMSAGIPGISNTGINYAAALGAIGGVVERQLQVIDSTSEKEREKAVKLVKDGHVHMGMKNTEEKLYIEVEVRSADGHQAKAIIATAHTNLVYLEKDGVCLLKKQQLTGTEKISPDLVEHTLSVESIYRFVNELDRQTDDLHMVELAIAVNKRIAEEGAQKPFGLTIGQHIMNARSEGTMGSDVVTAAMERTASGIDARMGGAGVPVVTNSGSGNQGITATIPVLTAAEAFGIDDDRLFRAVTLSHLMAIYIHCRFGLLSALCGATIAGTGASCGIVYLLGGGPKEIGYAINNMMGCVTGMLCDGAKADCAMKVSACVNMAFLSAFMAIKGTCVSSDEGIVEEDPAHTIRNFVRLGNDGSPVMDNIILDIMFSKRTGKMLE